MRAFRMTEWVGLTFIHGQVLAGVGDHAVHAVFRKLHLEFHPRLKTHRIASALCCSFVFDP